MVDIRPYSLPGIPIATSLSPHTSANRYPRIFRFVSSLARDTAELKILSFGCSTDLEVISLRADYFPLARIDGTDLEPERLARARELDHGGRSDFLLPTEMGDRTYDVIFAMSVLCLLPHKSHAELPFEKFDGAVRTIDSYLKPGGILACYNLQYHLEESGVGQRYTPLIDKDLYDNYARLAEPLILVNKYWKDGTPFHGVSPVVYRKVIG